jgi:hypothetical protein
MSKGEKLTQPANCQSPDEALISRLANKITELEKIVKTYEDIGIIAMANKSTPITPKSLEGIGFRKFKSELYIDVASNSGLTYHTRSKQFELALESHDDIVIEKLYFTSTEQIVEFVKCFQAKEGE